MFINGPVTEPPVLSFSRHKCIDLVSLVGVKGPSGNASGQDSQDFIPVGQICNHAKGGAMGDGKGGVKIIQSL